MTALSLWKKGFIVAACGILLLSGLCLWASETKSAQDKALTKKKIDLKRAFSIYTEKCMGCHVSVADPERPGRTRDTWYVMVNTMHGYGLGLTAEQSELIVDLLYALRPGLEKGPG